MRAADIANLFAAPQWLRNQLPLKTTSTSHEFDWNNTSAAEHFEWRNCYDGRFKCARLQVPMDWTGTSAQANKTVELAVIKVEATVPVTDAFYGGAVVLNPGGPGGSGVHQILNGGYHVRTLLSAGPDAGKDGKYFDIIGFDPRGVSHTRPAINCYPDRLAAAAASIEAEAATFLASSDTAFDNAWARHRALAESCSERAIENGLGMHMSTAPVARDVIEIFERHGEWREAEARRILHADSDASNDRAAVIERTTYRPGKEMVQYWGFSYGSILGATLAAMYPERIKRAVLDGVGDSHDYMAGGWTTNLQDTDLLFIRLASYCSDGGPENCALYHPDGPEAIVLNLGKIIEDFKHNPISVPDFNGTGPQTATAVNLQFHFRDIVYNPLKYFPVTTQILYDISQRNGTSLVADKLSRRKDLSIPIPEQCAREGPYSPSCFVGNENGYNAQMGILCSDAAPDRLNQTKDEYREYARGIMEQSRLLGESWAAIQMECTAWKARAHWRYDGKFHSPTANPILFVGNTIDPVTPLRNAFAMAKGFDGAGVLHQDSEGHCSYGSVSMCSAKSIRSYFQTGELPGKKGELEWDEWDGDGKLCEPNFKPLQGYTANSRAPLPEGETDEKLWKAVVGLNREWP